MTERVQEVADAAGVAAGSVARAVPSVGLPRVAEEPVGELVERLRARLGRAVDPMQVAAALESDGVTDAGAVAEYGHADVFALAEEVYRRLAPRPEPVPAPPAGPGWRVTARELAHGPLYLLPGALFPPVFAVLGRRGLVLVLVLAGGIGWAWGTGGIWLAYRLLGRGLPVSAQLVLRWMAVAGLLVTVLAATVVVVVYGGAVGLIGMAAGQMTYQMAAGILLYHRREAWLAAAMVPGTAAGLVYLVLDRPALAPYAVAAGAVSVLVLAVLAALVPRPPATAEPPLWRSIRPELPGLRAVGVYGALAAAFLLHAESRYVFDRLDLAFAAVPLILGMGVVEWRARVFREQAAGLLRRMRYPREFAQAVWVRLAVGLAVCLGALGTAAAPLLAVLHRAHALSAAGAVLAAAHVLLGGAYFLAFVLAGQGRYGPLAGALGAALAVHAALAPRTAPAGTDTAVLLGSAVLLAALLVVALGPSLGQVWRYG